jgi:hypothetical protein
MTKLTLLFIFGLLINGFCLYAQNDSLNGNTENVYQDFKNHEINKAKFILIINNEKTIVDSTILKTIDPDWLDKVNITTVDPGNIDSKIATVELYIRKKYAKNAKEFLNKEY